MYTGTGLGHVLTDIKSSIFIREYYPECSLPTMYNGALNLIKVVRAPPIELSLLYSLHLCSV